jgi:hypothetical protein
MHHDACYRARQNPSFLRKRFAALLSVAALVACGSTASTPADVGDAGDASDAGDMDANRADSGWSGTVVESLSGCVPSFQAKVTIGAQTFDLLVDTGSSTTAVVSTSCAECMDAGVAASYAPGPTAHASGAVAMARYGVGSAVSSWTGPIYSDTVSLPGSNAAVSLALVAIQDEMRFFTPTLCGTARGDGILGLGPSNATVSGTGSLLDAFVSAGMPDVFAAQLCDGSGRLWLGGFDRSVGSSDPLYVPLLPTSAAETHYAVTLMDLQLAGQTLGLPSSSFGPAILDTGTAFFLLPSDVYAALAKGVKASAGYQTVFGAKDIFDAAGTCYRAGTESPEALDANLPPITLKLGGDGGVALQLPASRSYVMPAMIDGAMAYCPGIRDGGTLPGTTGGKFVVGYPVLHANVTVFDRANQRVGFMPFTRGGACP